MGIVNDSTQKKYNYFKKISKIRKQFVFFYEFQLISNIFYNLTSKYSFLEDIPTVVHTV